jgi:hypothetical protein
MKLFAVPLILAMLSRPVGAVTTAAYMRVVHTDNYPYIRLATVEGDLFEVHQAWAVPIVRANDIVEVEMEFSTTSLEDEYILTNIKIVALATAKEPVSWINRSYWKTIAESISHLNMIIGTKIRNIRSRIGKTR